MSLSFTFLDALVVLIVLVSVGYATWRGFLWETLTIFAWVAAAFACLYFGPYVIPLMRSMVGEMWLASLLAYSAVFLAVFIPFAFISHRFSQTVKSSPIGPLDRAAGVAFGVVRGLVIVGLAYLAFTYFVPIKNHPAWVRDARLLPLVQDTSQVLLSVVPDHPDEFAYVPRHEDRPRIEQKAAIPRDMSSGAPAVSPSNRPAGHDPMADLIRKNEAANHVPVTKREPTPVRTTEKTAQRTSKAAKSYGASDRQALDTLVQSSGNGNQ
jgi:membrane protein required for colicin V production